MNVELIIDGKKIDINDFVKEFLGKTLEGAISSLSGVNNWKKLDIKVIK